ncbi:hypothetical protein ACFX11_045116 [Malus domestica]
MPISSSVERVKVCEDELCKRSASSGGESEQERVEDDTEEEEVRKLSKEDLNERVEAFIVMFRQHLSNAARGRHGRRGTAFHLISKAQEYYGVSQRRSSGTLSTL